jgi:hypothetical protein
MKKTNLSGMLAAVTGLLIVITPNWLFPVCAGLLELVNGKHVHMRCHWTARAEMILGGIVFATGLMIAFIQNPKTRQRLNHIVVLLGLATFLTPLYIIPTCANPDMACNVGTKPALLLLGSIAIALGLWGSRAPGLNHETTTG